MNATDQPWPSNRLRSIALAALSLLFAKVFLSILNQYRFYFPADFESDFLSLRREIFHGLYRAAFYVHIVSAPAAVLAGLFLVVSGHEMRFRKMHRRAGGMLAAIVLAFVTPSGLIMAVYAPAGHFAGAGLATLAISTAACLIMTIRRARQRQFRIHRRWALRCFILLCSPLLLRLITGFVIVTQIDPDLADRLNPWLSWLIPLASFETWWRLCEHADAANSVGSQMKAQSS